MLQKRNEFEIIEILRKKQNHIREIANSLNLVPSTVMRIMKKLETEAANMKEEILFLENTLKELENGVVPCWKRPDSPVPEIAGTIIIQNYVEYTIVHHTGSKRDISALEGETPSENREETKYIYLKKVLTEMFKEDMAYAASKNCYIRVKIENHTSSYALYRKYADVLKAMRIVLVNE